MRILIASAEPTIAAYINGVIWRESTVLAPIP
jgi:hypothetical protein